MRAIAAPALLAGLTSAILFLSALGGGLTFVAYFVQLPLFYLGFAFGLTPVALATALALAIVLALGGGVVGLLFLVTEAAPCLLVVRQSLLFRRTGEKSVEWYPTGAILGLLTALAAAMALIALLLAASGEGGLTAWFQNVAEALAAMLPAGGDEAGAIARLSGIAPYLAGITAASWLLMTAVNGLLGYALAARSGRVVRGPPSASGIVLPRWCAPACLLSLGLALVASGDLAYFARSLAVVFAVPFFLQGLAVVHVLVRRVPSPKLALALFYVALLIMSPPLALLVAALGLVEERLRLRPNPT